MHKGVASGGVDAGGNAALSLVQARARGVREVIIADMQLVDQPFVWVRSDSHIRQPKDLKGAKLGVKRFGGMVHTYGRAAAKALGLEKEVKFVAGGGLRGEIAAIKTGALDGRVGPILGMLPFKSKADLRAAIDLKKYLPKEWADVVVFANKDFVDRKSDLLRKVVKAYLQSAEFVEKNPQWAIPRLKSFFRTSEGIAKEIHAGLRYSRDGKINIKGLQNVINFVIEYGIIPKEKAPSLEQLDTNKFTG